MMMETATTASRLRNSSRNVVTRQRKKTSIRALLEWAFRVERVTLDFSKVSRLGGEPLPSFGMEYVMMERARLGCRVDGGGASPSHPDADLVADALSALPENYGGARMALRIAELARTQREPDCMVDAHTQCVPKEWRKNRHGWHSATEKCGINQVLRRGRFVTEEARWCPVSYTPSPPQIARARREYLAWCLALLQLRNTFQMYDNLTSFELTMEMPNPTPWKKHLTKS